MAALLVGIWLAAIVGWAFYRADKGLRCPPDSAWSRIESDIRSGALPRPEARSLADACEKLGGSRLPALIRAELARG